MLGESDVHVVDTLLRARLAQLEERLDVLHEDEREAREVRLSVDGTPLRLLHQVVVEEPEVWASANLRDPLDERNSFTHDRD